MALLAGTVTISDDGAVSGTANSLALDMYNRMWTRYATALLAAQQIPPPPGPQLASVRRGMAWLAEDMAAAVVGHFTAFGAARITTSRDALQTSTAAGNPTDAPPAQVDLPLV